MRIVFTVTDFVVMKLDVNQNGAVGVGEDLTPGDSMENSSTVLKRSTTETPVLLKMHANDADALCGAVAGSARARTLSSDCSACFADSLRCAIVRRSVGTRLIRAVFARVESILDARDRASQPCASPHA